MMEKSQHENGYVISLKSLDGRCTRNMGRNYGYLKDLSNTQWIIWDCRLHDEVYSKDIRGWRVL